jgi:hypothetical protein
MSLIVTGLKLDKAESDEMKAMKPKATRIASTTVEERPFRAALVPKN